MMFYGYDKAAEELELAGLKVDPTHRVGEPELAARRWFDYRYEHPALATYRFTHHYIAGVRHFYETCIDVRSVEQAKTLPREDVFDCEQEMTSMWLARRCADEVGCPYPFVMSFAHTRALNRHFFRFPRPNQLYGEEFEDDLAKLWKETVARSIQYSKELHMRADAKLRTPAWQEHQAFVLDQVKLRPSGSKHGLLGRLLKEGVLDATAISAEFGATMLIFAEQTAARLVSHR
jgi:hypothetical protein